jgi:hypothetical protein
MTRFFVGGLRLVKRTLRKTNWSYRDGTYVLFTRPLLRAFSGVGSQHARAHTCAMPPTARSCPDFCSRHSRHSRHSCAMPPQHNRLAAADAVRADKAPREHILDGYPLLPGLGPGLQLRGVDGGEPAWTGASRRWRRRGRHGGSRPPAPIHGFDAAQV